MGLWTRGWRGWPRVSPHRTSPTLSSTRARGAAPAPTTGSSARTLETSCWEPSRDGPGVPSSITLPAMADNVHVNIGNVMISWCENKLETKEIKFLPCSFLSWKHVFWKFCIYLFLSSLRRISITFHMLEADAQHADEEITQLNFSKPLQVLNSTRRFNLCHNLRPTH